MEGVLQDRRTLRAIAATLLALASLAERAVGRSFPVRFLVLAILCRADAAARAFVAGAIEADGPDLPCFAEPLGPRAGAADAEILALRLRMLAAVLGVLAGETGRSAGEEPRPGGAARLPRLPVLLLLRLPAARCRRHLPPHDTS